MFKVMLVDDEKDICEGLKYIIDWGQYGFNICATAYNGASAFETAMEQCPDLIVTDIKMPRMDGLELISSLNAEGIHCYFIILSGFSEFAYAQSALSLGVSNYLLKPVDGQELIAELEKIREALYKEKNLKSLEHSRSALLHNFFLHKLAVDRVNDVGRNQWTQYLPAGIDQSYYVVVAEHEGSEGIAALADETLGESLAELSEKLKEDVEFVELTLFFKLTDSRFGILFCTRSDVSETNICISLSSFFINNFAEQLAFGMSKHNSRAEDFGQAYDEAMHNMAGLASGTQEIAERQLSSGKLVEIIAYIDTHFDQCLDLQNLSAEVFHFHPVYIGKIIKRQTGLSFSEYLNKVRIQQATKLLRNSYLSITDVSQQVGYRYIDHFYKNFRKFAGMTPGDYRKKIVE